MASKLEGFPEQLNDKVSPDEAAEIVETIGDSKLFLDPNNKEYFCISFPEGTKFIPRLKTIPRANENGSISYISVEDFLRQTLTELDSKETTDSN
ncbi:MAG: hypothetical protein UV92_C0011G0015 [Parcubacteria group bacterium GW2011_GWA1_43_27]|nr:MAG: hypothetical protein UV92_C0011G0015 [Parcubacteria group bacterium GW2011_GWA1_43_27]KKT22408.1 MAG: hypothetical protein UW06_C0011G0014 [Parcubacteria group bacterium GW2011_GWE1_43_8]HBZ36762.1 hypothetical protein [Candidatus Veblenbacteria bacterium]